MPGGGSCEFGSGAALMGAAMDCASGTSTERMAVINRELPTALLGRMTNFPFPEICELLKLPALPADYRAPIVSTLPALFISGALDSNTPPYQAEEVSWGFPEQRPRHRGERRARKHAAAARSAEADRGVPGRGGRQRATGGGAVAAAVGLARFARGARLALVGLGLRLRGTRASPSRFARRTVPPRRSRFAPGIPRTKRAASEGAARALRGAKRRAPRAKRATAG